MTKDSGTKKVKAEKCWICESASAVTSEHRIKQKLLKDISQGEPLMHVWDEHALEKTAKNNSFKFRKMLCSNCNEKVTFAGDATFDKMTEFLITSKRETNSANLELFLESNIDCRNLQQYYAKITGCYLVQFNSSFNSEHSDLLLKELRKVIHHKDSDNFSIIFSHLPEDDTIYRLTEEAGDPDILLGSYFRNSVMTTKYGIVFSDSLLPFRITIITSHPWSINNTVQIHESRVFYYDDDDIEYKLNLAN